MKVLLSGVDTLEIGYGINEYINKAAFDELKLAKEAAQSTHNKNDLSGVVFEGMPFMVNRKAGNMSTYVMQNNDLIVSIYDKPNGGKFFPEVRVKFLSEYLWEKGWQTALNDTDKWVKGWTNVKETKPSRVDYCCDLDIKLPNLSPELNEVVTRTRKKSTYGTLEQANRYRNGLVQTGYSFGNDPILFRMYDKSKEIEISKKEWFRKLWQYDGSVTRFEFQCRRDYLKEYKINSIKELVDYTPDLWKNLTEKQIRLTTATYNQHEQGNTKRAENTDYWKLVSSADFGLEKGIDRMYQSIPKLRQLKQQFRGLAVSLAAWTTDNTTDGRDVLEYIYRDIISDPCFKDDIDARIFRYSKLPK